MATTTKFSVVVFALAPLAAWAVPPAQPTPATVTFLDTHAGTKAGLAGDGIGVVFGAPLAEDDDENTTTREFVDAFLITQGREIERVEAVKQVGTHSPANGRRNDDVGSGQEP